MLQSTKESNTDFNQTLQNVWLKSVLCSKLGGGLANSLIDFNVDVHPINNNYDELKAILHERILRNSDCVKQKASYVSMPDRMRSLDNMYDQDRRERDLYFYHSDHLGSSSFITDADGITTQHLQPACRSFSVGRYLPYGELFVEQRSTANYFTPYKFSAKEKDEETGYSYFGARYYLPDISIWGTVDQKADKGPSISPYVYCFNNPIILNDPDGKWPWEAKNIRDARKEARRSGGEFERWKGQDGRNWASVDRAKSDNYYGNAASDTKIFKPKGSSWAEKFKKFDESLEGGAHGDPGTDQYTTKQDIAVAGGVIGTLTGAGALIEGTTIVGGIIATSGILNNIDDIGTNSKGESFSQQFTNNSDYKKTIGNIKAGISTMNIFYGVAKDAKGIVKSPYQIGNTVTDANSVIQNFLPKNQQYE